jgi:hypothetical protein
MNKEEVEAYIISKLKEDYTQVVIDHKEFNSEDIDDEDLHLVVEHLLLDDSINTKMEHSLTVQYKNSAVAEAYIISQIDESRSSCGNIAAFDIDDNILNQWYIMFAKK